MYSNIVYVTGFQKINHFVTFNTLNISSSNKALHSTNQHCSELKISLYHELPEILWNILSCCYGNTVKYWVLFIPGVTKWLIFQNLVTLAMHTPVGYTLAYSLYVCFYVAGNTAKLMYWYQSRWTDTDSLWWSVLLRPAINFHMHGFL